LEGERKEKEEKDELQSKDGNNWENLGEKKLRESILDVENEWNC
jgi:hypothetical protein